MHTEKLLEMKDPKEISEELHELKKQGEQFLFWDSVSRLVLAREIPLLLQKKNTGFEEVMSHVSEVLGIRDRKSYEEVDQRYNLTMY
ncbi:MAG: hypothetical protein M1414_06975 [Candidatus Thermoplasmatota archaeon]|jgi:hypothetical protein|nr:hypothetical protein [Candidatus Thermoplasmatota archaeon]MCL5988623.1 hypothetical protein [Candidatus Thermoplasmatota archaeon]